MEETAVNFYDLKGNLPDGALLVYAAYRNKKASSVVDGQDAKYYDAIVPLGGGIVFDSTEHWHYLAVDGDEIYSVDEQLASPGVNA